MYVLTQGEAQAGVGQNCLIAGILRAGPPPLCLISSSVNCDINTSLLEVTGGITGDDTGGNMYKGPNTIGMNKSTLNIVPKYR